MTNKYFKIRDIQKYKILNETFVIILAVSAIGLFLFEIFLMPSENSSGDTQVLFFITFFPKWLQYFIIYSLIIFPSALFVKGFSKYSNKGIIYFEENSVRIKTRKRDVSIPVKSITEIIFVEKDGISTKKFSYIFIIVTRWNGVFRIKLLDEYKIDELVETIEVYLSESLKIKEEYFDPTEYDD